MTADTGFAPAHHGFPFPNWFPPGTPVVEVPTPFGRIRVGDASGGLCGGMVFAALDLYLHGVPSPAEPTRPVFRYLCGRLLDSWSLPFGVLKYYDWQRRPAACTSWHGARVIDGVSRLTIEGEWPRVRADLDCGLPVPLGLVKAHSFSPRQLPRNHQVLATGYDLDDATGALTIRAYDPNYPNEIAELGLNLRNPEAGSPVRHRHEGDTVRGFFRVDYRCPVEGPSFVE